MNEHIVIIRPQNPKTGLLDVIQNFLEKEGLKSIRRRIVLIEQKKAFIMEGTAAKPHKRLLGKVPKIMGHITGRCYVYETENIGEDEVNIGNTISQMVIEYGPTYISQSANEAEQMQTLLFG